MRSVFELNLFMGGAFGFLVGVERRVRPKVAHLRRVNRELNERMMYDS